MKTSNELSVKIRIVKIAVVSRCMILIAGLLLYLSGGFVTSVYREFSYILLPISILYLTLFLKFIARNAYRYPAKGQNLSREYIGMGYFGLLGLNMIEFLMILYKAFNFSALPILPIENFFFYIVVIEALFGFFTGLYISHLFSTKKAG